MTAAIPIPPPDGFSVEAYEGLTINYPHTELWDGRIVVNAAPLRWHNLVLRNLTFALETCAPRQLTVVQEQGLILGPRTEPEPDAMVIDADADDLDRRSFTPEVTHLVIEVASPSNGDVDRTDKPVRYAQAGIPHYWLIEREGMLPIVHSYELDPVTGRYVPTGVHREKLVVPVPFPVAIELASLIQRR